MSIKKLDNRGQISVEYLLLIVVILVVLGSITIPLIGKSIDASNDISYTSDAKIAVESVADAINLVYANGPGSKRTLNIRIPQNGMNFASTANNIQLVAHLSDQNKTVNADIKYPVNISQPILNGNVLYKVTVEWFSGAKSINVNIIAA